MSYAGKIEYRIIPTESFTVIHNCSGCGCKSLYVNTNRFRVNANGNKLDVWLIYQCQKCRHTLNLSVYERQNPDRIPKEEYRLFLENDEELANMYGRDFSFFAQNKAVVDRENIKYEIIRAENADTSERQEESAQGGYPGQYHPGDMLYVRDPFRLNIRKEKLAAQLLAVSRKRLKELMEQEKVVLYQEKECLKIEIR